MDVGAYQVDHVHHVSDVPEAVCLAGDQFDLVVGRLNPRVARTQADRVRDVLLAAFDLGVQFPERRDPVVTPPTTASVSGPSRPGRRRSFPAGAEGIPSTGTPDTVSGLPTGSCRAGRAGRRSGSPGGLPSAKTEPLIPAATFLASRTATALPSPARGQPRFSRTPSAILPACSRAARNVPCAPRRAVFRQVTAPTSPLPIEQTQRVSGRA